MRASDDFDPSLEDEEPLEEEGSVKQRSYDLVNPYGQITFAADFVDDLERTRIANENRLRAIARPTSEADSRPLAITSPEATRIVDAYVKRLAKSSEEKKERTNGSK